MTDSEPRIVAAGIDTLELFSRASIKPHALRELEQAQLDARRAHAEDRKVKGAPFVLAGQSLTMAPHGGSSAPFLAAGEHMAVKVNPGAVSTFPTLGVELRALDLWQNGARASAETAEAVAEALCRRDEDEKTLHVTRCDLCVDFQGWQPAPADAERFITRAHDRSMHWQGAPSKQGRAFTGFTFGRGDVAARLYRKDLEVLKSGKPWFPESVWPKAGAAYRPGEPVWRLEFQLRRPALVSVKRRGAGALYLSNLRDARRTSRAARGERKKAPPLLDTWRDVFDNARDLWRYLAGRWLRLDSGRTADERINPTAEWEQLTARGFADGLWGGTSADLYRAHREDSAKRATVQLAGYMARGLAEWTFLDQADGLVEPTLEDAIPSLVKRVREHTQKSGRSVEARAAERVASWKENQANTLRAPALLPEPEQLDPYAEQLAAEERAAKRGARALVEAITGAAA